jgi:hypothetical protein
MHAHVGSIVSFSYALERQSMDFTGNTLACLQVLNINLEVDETMLTDAGTCSSKTFQNMPNSCRSLAACMLMGLPSPHVDLWMLVATLASSGFAHVKPTSATRNRAHRYLPRASLLFRAQLHTCTLSAHTGRALKTRAAAHSNAYGKSDAEAKQGGHDVPCCMQASTGAQYAFWSFLEWTAMGYWQT